MDKIHLNPVILLMVVAISLFIVRTALHQPTVFAVNTTTIARPSPIFPTDHQAHPDFAEWWYFNIINQVADSSGTSRELSHLISFSRIGNQSGLLTSTYNSNTKEFEENTYQGTLTVSTAGNLKIAFQGSDNTVHAVFKRISATDFTLEGETPEMGTFTFQMKSSNFDNPIKWGGTGIINVFKENDTTYYSVPDLETTGTIDLAPEEQYVVSTGKTWMDHQYFSQKGSSDWLGHYWLSFHTSEGDHYGFVTQEFTSGFKNTYWVKYSKKINQHLSGTDGSITATADNEDQYPKSLKLNIPSLHLELIISPTSMNQVYTPPIQTEFFEPSALFSGTISGKNFTGQGFFETHLKGSRSSPANSDGDFDVDCDVDIYDYNLFSQHYDQINCQFNLIDDCKVDDDDLKRFLELYGNSCQ